MSVFDEVMKRVGGAPDDVSNLASKVGIDPDLAEKAVAALSQAHQMEGDTVEIAAAKTGIDQNTISTIIEQIGGEGSLMAFANAVKDDPSSFSKLLNGLGFGVSDLADKAKDFLNRN
ncbi:MAG: hypothetical protein ACK5NN_01025 [Sphingomonadaceae bacterium]